MVYPFFRVQLMVQGYTSWLFLNGILNYLCLLLRANIKRTMSQHMLVDVTKHDKHILLPVASSWHVASTTAGYGEINVDVSWYNTHAARGYSALISRECRRGQGGTLWGKRKSGWLGMMHWTSIIYLPMTEHTEQKPISRASHRKWRSRYDKGWAHSCKLQAKFQLTSR